jgi:hypothetical protein
LHSNHPPPPRLFFIIPSKKFKNSSMILDKRSPERVYKRLPECPICLVDMTKDIASLKNCSHAFHRSCIEQSLEKSLRCPLCLIDMTFQDVNNLIFNIEGIFLFPKTRNRRKSRIHKSVQIRVGSTCRIHKKKLIVRIRHQKNQNRERFSETRKY